VRAHLEGAGLARQKWPEEVHAADDFPRTPSGKLQKFRLRHDLATPGDNSRQTSQPHEITARSAERRR